MAKKPAQSVSVNIAKTSANPGIVLVTSYFVLFAVNALVIYLANVYFPRNVVLGTFNINLGWSIFHSMGTLALINILIIPFIREIERWKGRMLTPMEWMVKYFVINFVGVWAITRFSEQFGLGVSSWLVVVILAAVLDLVQGVAMMQIGKVQK